MKFKSLLLSSLILATGMFFVGCEEPDKPLEVYDISAKVGADVITDVNFTTEAGTSTFVITSSHAWTLEKIIVNPLDGETDAWLTVSAESGNAGETTITVSAPANPSPGKERAVLLKFKTGDLTPYAPVTVSQAGLPKKEYENMSISALRTLFKENQNIPDGKKITGTVVSDLSENGNNINGKSMLVQDGTGVNSGICIRFNEYDEASKYALGDKIFVVIEGATLSEYNGLLQCNLSNDDNVYFTGEANAKLAPVTITCAELKTGNYESMYVQIENCQVKEASLTSKMSGNIPMEVENDGGDFIMYTAPGAAFKDESVPQKKGTLKGVAGIYNSTYQVQPVLYSDCDGMTEDRFVVEKETSSTRDDFATVTAVSSYGARETTEGWVGTNCAVMQGGESDSNPTFMFIGANSDTKAFTINGKTTAVGVITSPVILNGCGTLSLKYGYAFGEANGVNFKIEILQNNAVVKTFTVTKSDAAQKTVYTFSDTVNVTGKFKIKITNLSPTNSTSNKDRYSIWDIVWTNNSGS